MPIIYVGKSIPKKWSDLGYVEAKGGAPIIGKGGIRMFSLIKKEDKK
jgi:hypothetical protein